MNAFWSLAKSMARVRGLVALALVFAVISAFGLGAGVLGMTPVLEIVLGEPPERSGTADRTDSARAENPGRAVEANADIGEADYKGLPELAAQLNDAIPNWAPSWAGVPQTTIDTLPEGPFTAIVVILIALGILTVIGATANFLHQWLAITAVHRTIATIRRQAMRRALRVPLASVVQLGASDLINRIVNDASALAGGFTSLLSKAVAQITKGIAAFIAALIIDWRLTLAACIVAPIMAVVIRKLGKKIRRASRSALEMHALLLRSAGETLQGLRVVRTSTAEREQLGRFERANQRMLKEMLRVRTFRAIASPLIEVLTIAMLCALVLVSVKLILDGHLDRSSFVSTLIALGIAGASLRPVTGLVTEIQASAAAATRLQTLLSMPTETDDPAAERTKPRLPRHHDSIWLDTVSFGYPGQDAPAIDGVSLDITHGQTVAFVGPNGCGKTTLLSMIPRLFDPDQGRVTIDGTDIRTVRLRSLRRQIGVVAQEPVLFAGTVAQNIAWGARQVSREQIIDAARRSHADTFIRAMDGGYDAMISEEGKSLSGGQRQRLAIARAILRDPSILILDEATSMIDADSEAQITKALADFGAGRTVLIVAHRLSTVVNADRIVVMNAGRIQDAGTHSELLERCELYQDLTRHQLVPSA
jgi:subfamily B ATP-binding cassette protein MsbA